MAARKKTPPRRKPTLHKFTKAELMTRMVELRTEVRELLKRAEKEPKECCECRVGVRYVGMQVEALIKHAA
jgi:hypothetical protein